MILEAGKRPPSGRTGERRLWRCLPRGNGRRDNRDVPNLLQDAVLEELKIFFAKISNRITFGIVDDRVDHNPGHA